MLQNVAFALVAAFASAAGAQPSARPDPADPKAAVPVQRYESVFQTYRGYADPELARWREANEEVSRLGGHPGHVPRATRPRTKTPQPTAQPGHGGHK